MFEVVVNVGGEEQMCIRGCEDGVVELCKWGTLTATKTQEAREGWCAYKWYASPEQAFNRVMQMRVGRTMASTLQELVEAIRGIRADIRKELGTAVNPDKGN